MVDGLDTLGWEDAHSPSTSTPPAGGVRAVQQFDGVTAQETQLGHMMRPEVTDGAGVARPLEAHATRNTDESEKLPRLNKVLTTFYNQLLFYTL